MYILDIETTADKALIETYTENLKPDSRLKDKRKIEESLEKKKAEAASRMALDHDYADVLCVGVKPLGGEPMVLTLEEYADWCNAPNPDFTSRDSTVLNGRMMAITFNGAEFDFPILIKAGIKKGLDLPYSSFKRCIGKYQKGHVDLMQQLMLVWGGNKSLDHYLQIYLGIAKTPIDFETADEEEIREHCKEDLINTEKLYELMLGKLVHVPVGYDNFKRF